jgi:hypothetical protein
MKYNIDPFPLLAENKILLNELFVKVKEQEELSKLKLKSPPVFNVLV